MSTSRYDTFVSGSPGLISFEQDDDSGASALHNAVERDLGDIVEFLLRHPRVKRDLKNKKGKTAEKVAQERSKKNKTKKIYELFKA